MSDISDSLLSHAAWLLGVSLLMLFIFYVVFHEFRRSHIYFAFASPGVLVSMAVFSGIRYNLPSCLVMEQVAMTVIFFPAAWVFPFATGFAARQLFIEIKGNHTYSAPTLVTVLAMVFLTILYFFTEAVAVTAQENW
jgi:hypothetical protein